MKDLIQLVGMACFALLVILANVAAIVLIAVLTTNALKWAGVL